jgi:hypothetical protein
MRKNRLGAAQLIIENWRIQYDTKCLHSSLGLPNQKIARQPSAFQQKLVFSGIVNVGEVR